MAGWLNLDRSFSLSDILWGIALFFLRVFFVAMPFAAGIYLKVRCDDEQSGSCFSDWLVYAIGVVVVLVVVCADYFKDYRRSKSSLERQGQDTILFRTISGVVWHSVDFDYDQNIRHYVTQLLHAVEATARVVCVENGSSSSVEISANLMKFVDEPGATAGRSSGAKFLRLREYWGTRLEGRADIDLPVDFGKPLPGAPAAYVRRSVEYIEDTAAPEVADYFDQEKSYKSIVSVPVFIGNMAPIGVINIDCNVPRGFGSKDNVLNELVPKLKPLVGLLLLHKSHL